MATLFILAGFALLFALIFMVVEAFEAPLGYEDDTGFHQGTEPIKGDLIDFPLHDSASARSFPPHAA